MSQKAEKRLRQPCREELVEKGSRFIGLSYPLSTLDEFEKVLSTLQQEYGDATHIVYAYKIFDSDQAYVRCTDDGEPSGTAGRPILALLDGRNLMQCAVFVVRYYGGTKLGAGGLVRAYSKAAKLALPDEMLEDFEPEARLDITIAYDQKRLFDYQLEKCGGRLESASYETHIFCEVCIPLAQKEQFLKDIVFISQKTH